MLSLCCRVGFSLVVVTGGYSLVEVLGPLIAVALVGNHGLGCVGFSSCSTQAQKWQLPGCKAQAP